MFSLHHGSRWRKEQGSGFKSRTGSVIQWTDPRIRIRIKTTRIRNTGKESFKGLVAPYHSFLYLFLHLSSRHTAFHSCYNHCFSSVEGWCAEPRFELGPAVQQAGALLSEPRRTLMRELCFAKSRSGSVIQCTDPMIRIRIKTSRIRNTGKESFALPPNPSRLPASPPARPCWQAGIRPCSGPKCPPRSSSSSCSTLWTASLNGVNGNSKTHVYKIGTPS